MKRKQPDLPESEWRIYLGLEDAFEKAGITRDHKKAEYRQVCYLYELGRDYLREYPKKWPGDPLDYTPPRFETEIKRSIKHPRVWLRDILDCAARNVSDGLPPWLDLPETTQREIVSKHASWAKRILHGATVDNRLQNLAETLRELITTDEEPRSLPAPSMTAWDPTDGIFFVEREWMDGDWWPENCEQLRAYAWLWWKTLFEGSRDDPWLIVNLNQNPDPVWAKKEACRQIDELLKGRSETTKGRLKTDDWLNRLGQARLLEHHGQLAGVPDLQRKMREIGSEEVIWHSSIRWRTKEIEKRYFFL